MNRVTWVLSTKLGRVWDVVRIQLVVILQSLHIPCRQMVSSQHSDSDFCACKSSIFLMRFGQTLGGLPSRSRWRGLRCSTKPHAEKGEPPNLSSVTSVSLGDLGLSQLGDLRLPLSARLSPSGLASLSSWADYPSVNLTSLKINQSNSWYTGNEISGCFSGSVIIPGSEKYFLSVFYNSLSINHKYAKKILILKLCIAFLETQSITLASNYYRRG